MIFIYNHQKLQIIKPFLLLSKINEECLLRDLVRRHCRKTNNSLHFVQKYLIYLWCLENLITVL